MKTPKFTLLFLIAVVAQIAVLAAVWVRQDRDPARQRFRDTCLRHARGAEGYAARIDAMYPRLETPHARELAIKKSAEYRDLAGRLRRMAAMDFDAIRDSQDFAWMHTCDVYGNVELYLQNHERP